MVSKAREIIEERLARGEITPQEFDSLVAKIQEPTTTSRPHQPPLPSSMSESNAAQVGATTVSTAAGPTLAKKGWFWWMLPAIFVVPFRITQPELTGMGTGIQIVTIAALALMAIGAVKWIGGR